MDVGRRARCGTAGAAIALLLLASLVPCLVHMEGSEPDDLCLSFCMPTGPGVGHQLLPAGHSAPPLGAVYRVAPADLPVPPPKA
jgi:hypothetical protein